NGELAFLVPLAIFVVKGAIAGAAMDAGMELASQLIDNGGNIDCLDWGDVASSGINGGISGGLTGPLGKAFTAAKRLRKAAGKAAKHPRRPGLDTMQQADQAATGADGKIRCRYCGSEVKDGIGSATSKE